MLLTPAVILFMFTLLYVTVSSAVETTQLQLEIYWIIIIVL